MQHLAAVSPRAADPAVRIAFIEAAAHLLATEGRASLSTRRLASEVGTSTMGLYTYFGSMDELIRGVRREGLSRLAAQLLGVRKKDPVAYLVHLLRAYVANAKANPDLYRVMFVEVEDLDEEDGLFARSTHETLTEAVQGVIDAGRFKPAKTSTAADLGMMLWTMVHGLVTLHLATLIDEDAASRQLDASVESLFIGFGDSPAATRRSLRLADEEQAVRRRLDTLIAPKL